MNVSSKSLPHTDHWTLRIQGKPWQLTEIMSNMHAGELTEAHELAGMRRVHADEVEVKLQCSQEMLTKIVDSIRQFWPRPQLVILERWETTPCQENNT